MPPMLGLSFTKGPKVSTLEAKIARLAGDQLSAAVERYVADLGRAVGEQEAAELLVAAALAMLYRAKGGEKTNSLPASATGPRCSR